MSVAPQELSETTSQMFAPMDHLRSQSATPTTESVSALVAYTIAIPSTVALVVSAYLAYATFTMTDVAGCGGGSIFDCGHVLHSKWSKAAGIPVSVFAFATHAILISGLFVTISQGFGNISRKLANCAVLTAAVAASVAALYFISLQVFVLKHLCSYCMAAHVCGLIVGSIALWKIPVSTGLKKTLAGVSLLGIAGLATIQIASAEPPKYKIDTFAPVETEQSDQESVTFESPGGDSDDLFSAPNESDGADIFTAPVPDGASTTPKQNHSFQFPAREELAMLSIISGQGMAFTSNALLLVAPTQDAPTPAAQNQQSGTGSAAKSGSDSKPKQDAQTPTKSTRLVQMNGGSIKLKAVDWPLVGDPDAKYIFIEMFDYTCEHCRATNKAIEVAKKSLGKDLAVVVLPVPMNLACNPLIKTSLPAHAESCELSRLAIAVWRLDAKKFGDFHHWMFEGKTAPTYSQAFAKAAEWVGSDELNKELAKTICSQYVDRNIELYKRAGGGPIPKLVFKQTTIVGEYTSGDSLTDLIKQYSSAK